MYLNVNFFITAAKRKPFSRKTLVYERECHFWADYFKRKVNCMVMSVTTQGHKIQKDVVELTERVLDHNYVQNQHSV